jgi:phage I-like protein
VAEENIAIIGHRVASLEEDRNEILQVLKELNVAVNKLVIIDERQVQAALIMDRLTKTTDRAHQRIDEAVSELSERLDRSKSECMLRDSEQAKSLEDLTSALGKSVAALKTEHREMHKDLEGRVRLLENAEIENRRIRNVLFTAMGLLGAAVAAAIFKLIGLAP